MHARSMRMYCTHELDRSGILALFDSTNKRDLEGGKSCFQLVVLCGEKLKRIGWRKIDQ